jgi:hypothetical protein
MTIHKLAKIVLVLVAVGTAYGQPDQTCYGPAVDCRPCPQEGCNVPVALPNGNTVQQDHQGQIWLTTKATKITMRVGTEGKLTVPVTGEFNTVFAVNLPESDVLNGPKSVAFQIDGDCQSRTYMIQGVQLWSGKNMSGFPTDGIGFGDLMDIGQAGILRRVMPDTASATVFQAMCKATAEPIKTTPPEDVQRMMDHEEALNDICRDGSGADPDTMKTCEIRDNLLQKIKTKGYCWGHDGQISADRTWEPCQVKP